MKRDEGGKGEHGSGSFAERVRERLHRGTETARRMIERVRELVVEPSDTEQHPATAHPTAAKATPPVPPKPAPRAASTTPRVEDGADDEDTSAETETNTPDLAVSPEFATATMGAILLEQGRPREALVVFTRLLTRNPLHAEAQRGAAACRAALSSTRDSAQAGGTDTSTVEPTSMLDRDPPPDHYDDSFVRALPVDPSSMVVFWEVTPAALDAARERLGARGTLALRVVSERGEHDYVERFIDDVPSQGDFFLRNLPRGAVHHASLGIRSSEGFIAFGDAESVTTPRGTPTGEIARVQGTVLIPPRTEGGPVARSQFLEVVGPTQHVSRLLRRHATEPLSHAVTPLETPTPTWDARPSTTEAVGFEHPVSDDGAAPLESFAAMPYEGAPAVAPSSDTTWGAHGPSGQGGASSPAGSPWSRKSTG